jgi:metal-responsive CopG/Arc/MetJ family transcriptional regulator
VETQNVTLSLPKDVLRKVKVAAAERGTSISSLLVEALRELVDHDDEYHSARERSVAGLGRPADLGTKGRTGWTRDELHAR